MGRMILFSLIDTNDMPFDEFSNLEFQGFHWRTKEL